MNDQSQKLGANPNSIDATQSLLSQANYVADRSLATTIFLSIKLGRPLFLEGEAGVGKTEVAKVLAEQLGRKLIRLQCYEGLDISGAAYEWNIQRQMLAIRMAEGKDLVKGSTSIEADIYGPQYLIKRALVQALEQHNGKAPVLLIDELDRADEPFEAYLLEVLSDFQITIPELGTIKAVEPPLVILTSNRTREIHDAIKRRCLYYWVDYPTADRELAIIKAKAPEASARLSQEVVLFVQRLRTMDLFKLPGVAETIDWTRALLALDSIVLEPETINNTLGTLLKYQDDIAKVQGSEAAAILSEVRAKMGQAAR